MPESPSAYADPGEDTAAALKLWVVLTRALRAVSEHLARDLQRHGLAPTEFGVLEALHHRGPRPLSELATLVLLTSGSITYVVDKLERRGLIRRQPSASDRRVVYAHLTDDGRALIERIFPLHAQAIRTATQGLTTEEKRLATTLLRRMGLRAQELP